MPAKNPEEICHLFQRAMAEGDLDSVLSVYDPEFDGVYEDDPKKIPPVLHACFHMFSVTDGKLNDVSRDEWIAHDHVGVWASIGTGGTVRVGDPVVLVGSSHLLPWRKGT
jgi:hypothetical protein